MSSTESPGQPEAPSPVWTEIAARHPPGFFCSRDGQELWRREYAGRKFPGRPAAWSLPPELGPWPVKMEGVVLRILSLLPGASAAIVGDFLWGAWRFPSEKYRTPANQILKQMETLTLVGHRAGRFWEEWRAMIPTAKRLDPYQNCTTNVRAFIDRHRLAAFEARSGPRLAIYKQQIETQIRRLESAPASQRDDAWKAEQTGWRRLLADWDAPAGT